MVAVDFRAATTTTESTMSITRTTSLLVLSTSLGACQAAESTEFRVGYTTHVTLSGGDEGGGPTCDPEQPVDIDARRSLFETHEDALTAFTMTSVLQAISVNGGAVSQPASVHDQFIDTYNQGPGLGLGANCNDEVAFNGSAGLNGYPHACARAEGQHIGDIEGWFPIAAVNRFDLAPSDGTNCGEARLVMANDSGVRMFVIFEAKIPNPDPECGIDACAPVQQFWADLSAIDDPAVRAQELEMAYLDGHTDLEAAGFGPFMSAENFTFGAGQIRTNNFDQFPWTLREFKAVVVEAPSGGPGGKGSIDPVLPELEQEAELGLVGNGAGQQIPPPEDPELPPPPPIWEEEILMVSTLRLVPVPVAANPFGSLWNDNLSLPHSAACQDALVATVQHLMTDDPNLMGVVLPAECLAAESPDSSVQQYHQRLAAGGSGPGSLEQRIEDEIDSIDPSSTLTPANIARRAAFAGGCIGCHQQTNGAPLGNGVNAPSSAGFVHTREFQFEDCGNGDPSCFFISSALKNSFLPHREQVMEEFLNGGPCCEEPSGGSLPPPHKPFDPMLESAIEVEALVQTEATERRKGSQFTVGGGSVLRSH